MLDAALLDKRRTDLEAERANHRGTIAAIAGEPAPEDPAAAGVHARVLAAIAAGDYVPGPEEAGRMREQLAAVDAQLAALG